MNKNPYEVRLDVMKMAQEMLDREVELEQTTYFTRVETLRSSNAPAEAIASLQPPKMYGPDDVIARATTLYNFVNNSTPSKKDTK